ncbi:MAG TPA: inositol monophosphatase family protein [Anaerolineaceae bacterium]|nr:inositol monophosphatase family protein [Anaerolineaceae bacterium]
MNFPQRTDIEQLARQAGAILREGYGKQHQIGYKGKIDVVTEADHASEAFLIQSIQARFPGHGIVAEESGSLGASQDCWYIDPLDGTVNYAHHLPIFAVSIGFARQGELRLGAVYDPMRDELFSAERGKGAALNGEPIHVSETAEMIRSLLVTGFPYGPWEEIQRNLDNYALFTRHCQAIRRLGSAALDLCYIACGRLDGFWEIKLSPWDVAAGGLIALEAGAVVTDLQGQADFMQPPNSILAANPQIHPQMLKIFQDSHSR